MSETPVFPPLITGIAAGDSASPMEAACAAAVEDGEAGHLFYRFQTDTLSAAILLAPEVPLEDAMTALLLAGIGFGDALGALAPPEVGVHFEWPAGFRVNGGRCGELSVAASATTSDEVPDWLIVGLMVPLWAAEDQGYDPETTVLFAEGCAEVSPVSLLESWSRHFLVWLDRWQEEGAGPIHREWLSRAWKRNEDVTVRLAGKDYRGRFSGLDEKGSMILRSDSDMVLLPLTGMLEEKC
ncbi:biotin/lipoate--protein ligase family protein [Algicella marina]|uniref:DUF4444 domain-containing protein n=1 Tax=Algicella marina TaxID=2683284 RepID=A0A6P1SXU0_9RHOB|nr:biotin/lipoate--protein ligase family protein [Algicella marina]QHQ35288.1 DUF4444 domain-containing protein [Algicella marina]